MARQSRKRKPNVTDICRRPVMWSNKTSVRCTVNSAMPGQPILNMANSLLVHESIVTTLPKAKELRRVVEPLITLGKKPSLANRRLAFNRTRDRDVVVKLFDDLGQRFVSRNGGYIRILKCGFRQGDNAPLALVELVDKADTRDE